MRKHPASCQISKRSDVRLVAALFVMSEISCDWQQLSSQTRAPPSFRGCFPTSRIDVDVVLASQHRRFRWDVDVQLCSGELIQMSVDIIDISPFHRVQIAFSCLDRRRRVAFVETHAKDDTNGRVGRTWLAAHEASRNTRMQSAMARMQKLVSGRAMPGEGGRVARKQICKVERVPEPLRVMQMTTRGRRSAKAHIHGCGWWRASHRKKKGMQQAQVNGRYSGEMSDLRSIFDQGKASGGKLPAPMQLYYSLTRELWERRKHQTLPCH